MNALLDRFAVQLDSPRFQRQAVAALAMLAAVAFVVLAWLPALALFVSLGLLLAALLVALMRIASVKQRQALDDIKRHVAERESAIYGCIEARLALDKLVGPSFELPPMRGPVISPDAAWRIYRHVLAERPEVVVEFGSGVSTLLLSHALERNGSGRVVSLDHEARFAAETRELIERHGLGHRAEVFHAPLRDVHANEGPCSTFYDPAPLEGIERVGLVLVDGPPRGVHPEVRHLALPLMASKLKPGGMLLLDDAARPGERSVLERWREAFPGFTFEELPLDTGLAWVRKRGNAGEAAR